MQEVSFVVAVVVQVLAEPVAVVLAAEPVVAALAVAEFA